MSRFRALLLYSSLSVPFGIAVHLGSEFAGLGRDADDLAFSALHAYLALIAVAALALFAVAAGFFTGAGERRRRIALMIRALPYQGRGVGFFAFSAALQFGFFLVTQIGEGCPLCRGDFLVGVVAAVVASVVGAFALVAFSKELVRAIATFGIARERRPVLLETPRARFVAFAPLSVYATFAVTLGNRPPPQHS